jgi:PAS domain S-box-containing protein
MGPDVTRAEGVTDSEAVAAVHESGPREDRDGVLWRAFVEASPDVLLVLDPEGTILFVNRVAPVYADRTVVGKKAWEFGVGKARERLLGYIETVVETRAAVRYEHPGIQVDGSMGWYEIRAIPVVVDGRVERIIWSATDISERKHAQELIAQVSEPVVATDSAGMITYWNAAAEQLYGWSSEEVLGKDSTVLLQTRWPGPGRRESFLSSIRSTSAWEGELSHVTRAGDEIIVDVSVRLLRDGAGEPTASIAVMRDATKRRRLEEQLRQSQKMEAIGLLAGGVAHDFNNLLAVILGFSELAARKLPPGHPVTEQLSEVFDAARRGGDLTRKLLAFSRKQIIQPRPLDLGATVGDFTRLLSRILGEDVDLVVDAPGETLVVRADAVQLEQVLLNLCTNARQAMAKGGTLRLSMAAATFDEVRVRREPWAHVGSYAELAVSDTGVGMDDATRLRVFEPFFTTKPEGTGLGLATVYGIVRQHGGFVHVQSAPGHGTTFRVFLPRAADGEEAPVRSSGRISSGPRRLQGSETILLAEDEPSLRSLVSTTLTELGYKVVAAADGVEAVEQYEKMGSEISLVLLDVVMPRLDARAAYERIAAKKPGVRVLFMTGYAPESTRLAELVQSGKLPMIEKPFTPEALAAKVRSVLDRAPPSPLK